MRKEKIFFTNSKGWKLAAWLHMPDGNGPFPAVIRAHGYKGSKDGGTSTALAEKCTDMVYFRFDFHAHGESEGKEVDAKQCVDDLSCAIDFVRGLEYVDKARIAITGSSLGGLATTLAAAWHGKIACAVPVCPVSTFEPFRVRDIKYSDLLDYNVYTEAERIDVPVLIVHGDADDIVPIAQSIELEKHLKSGKLHVIQGGNHEFEGHREEMYETVSSFIRERLHG